MNGELPPSQQSYVDTHCHLDLYPDPRKVMAETEAQRVVTIAVTNAPSVFRQTAILVKGCRYIRPAVGLHPELVVSRAAELPLMWPLLEETRYVGEVGLDYSETSQASRTQQLSVFTRILERCASYGNKVITVHSRGAEADVISAIDGDYPGRIILHWYSGPVRELQKAVQAGVYFSVNPAMSRSERGRRLVARMPRDQVLTESDGPFVLVGSRAAYPSDVPQVVVELARIWDVDPDQAKVMVRSNFQRLLQAASPA